MATLWALLVGIDNYPQEPINGAVADVDKTYDYLVHDRGIRPECIQVLRDEEATRDSILAAFRHHLIANPAIRKDDPILFHFSGHGTREPMPEGHRREHVRSTGPEGDDDAFECIVPFDAVRDRADDPDAAPPIPDFTLGALLRRTAARHGRNVTCVLDCCHSGDGTRQARPRVPAAPTRWRKRVIDARLVGRLRPDTDAELWAEDTRGGVAPWRGGVHDREDTHVLMAACEWWEQSSGSDDGGIFTGLWLEALREGDGLSYQQILERIRSKLVAFYQSLPIEHRPDEQHPQVEGVGCDRPVFEPAGGDSRHRFAVQPAPDPTECIVFAGALAGVTAGTVFQLQRVGPNIAGTADAALLGTAVATEVQATQCVAKVARGVRLPRPPEGVRALLTQLAEPLQVCVDRSLLGGEAAGALEAQLRGALQNAGPHEGTWFELIDDAGHADLILEVEDDQVLLIRKTPILRELETAPPRVKAADVRRVFPSALRNIARFHFYLSLSSHEGPFAADVSMHLHYLREPEPTYSDDEYMDLGDEIAIEDGEATVLHEEDTLYGLVLHNLGNHSLYPYVLFFDPMTYTVQFFYECAPRQPPPLRPGEQLQLGRSPMCPSAMWFVVDDECHKDTGFLKVILAAEPIDLKFMEQPASIGYDRESGDLNYSHVRGGGPSGGVPQPVKGAYDVLTVKITVLPSLVA